MGWEEKIDQMWLHKAAQIKRHLAKKATSGYSAQAAAFFPVLSVDTFTEGAFLTLAAVLVIVLVLGCLVFFIAWLISKNR